MKDKKEKPKKPIDLYGDPEPHDENDPAYQAEIFATMKYMGQKPEQITTDPKFREAYRAYLTANP